MQGGRGGGYPTCPQARVFPFKPSRTFPPTRGCEYVRAHRFIHHPQTKGIKGKRCISRPGPLASRPGRGTKAGLNMCTLNILYVKKQVCLISPLSETHEVKGFHFEKSSGIFNHLRLEPFLDILNPPAGRDKGQSSPLCCGCSTNALSECSEADPPNLPENLHRSPTLPLTHIGGRVTIACACNKHPQ